MKLARLTCLSARFPVRPPHADPVGTPIPAPLACLRAAATWLSDPTLNPFHHPTRLTTVRSLDISALVPKLSVCQISDRIQRFRELHQAGCFVIPNPWDAGSARMLANLGFPALATTSAGSAWSLGRRDNAITLDQALAHLRAIVAAVELPVNADFEGGFAVEPAGVAANVAAAIETGIAGLSIEDSSGDPNQPLFDFDLSVERIRAARQAIDESGTGVLLVGRSEGFVVGRPDLAETIRRLTAYAEAGADCLYAPRLRTREEISAVVGAVAPKPVNVLAAGDFTVAELAALGVRRISVGGTLARVALTGFLEAAREIATEGTFTRLSRAVPFDEIDGSFA